MNMHAYNICAHRCYLSEPAEWRSVAVDLAVPESPSLRAFLEAEPVRERNPGVQTVRAGEGQT